MFLTVPLSIIRSFSLYTQQWCMSYRFADSLRASTGTVRNMQFYSTNKFENLVHLVGFIIRIYRDARSLESQILLSAYKRILSTHLITNFISTAI